MPNILDTVQISGSSYDLKDKNAPSVSAVTQQEYDNLPSSAKTSNTFFVISDATPADMSQYWTSAQTQSAITQAVSGKQDTLVSSVNIKTINNTSILGSGNIDIQGGGKAIEAGRGISITTGETADTVSFSLPISAGTGTNSIAEGDGSKASGMFGSHAEGYASQAIGWGAHSEGNRTVASGNYSHAEGNQTVANGNYSHAEGFHTEAKNLAEHASGQYNNSVSASTTFGDSGNTLFSVGNGTSNSARHNAFEIRQNGDIYLSSGGTDIKLQDYLGGGGGSITIDPSLDSGSSNAVANSAITSAISTVSAATSSNTTALGGLSLVKLTQAEYDALSPNYDSSTLYIIT